MRVGGAAIAGAEELSKPTAKKDADKDLRMDKGFMDLCDCL